MIQAHGPRTLLVHKSFVALGVKAFHVLENTEATREKREDQKGAIKYLQVSSPDWF